MSNHTGQYTHPPPTPANCWLGSLTNTTLPIFLLLKINRQALIFSDIAGCQKSGAKIVIPFLMIFFCIYVLPPDNELTKSWHSSDVWQHPDTLLTASWYHSEIILFLLQYPDILLATSEHSTGKILDPDTLL